MEDPVIISIVYKIKTGLPDTNKKLIFMIVSEDNIMMNS